MNILAVDDEPIVLWSLMKNLEEIFCNPQDNVQGDVYKRQAWMIPEQKLSFYLQSEQTMRLQWSI